MINSILKGIFLGIMLICIDVLHGHSWERWPAFNMQDHNLGVDMLVLAVYL